MLQSAISPAGHEWGVTSNITNLNGFDSTADLHQRAEPRDIWKARKFIEERSSEPLSLIRVADAAGINPTHLSEKFKQVTGTKFVDYVAQRRFEHARKLLENVDLRVSEIAFAVGFQSLSQFNRVFRKFAGESPTQYRNSHPGRRNRRSNLAG